MTLLADPPWRPDQISLSQFFSQKLPLHKTKPIERKAPPAPELDEWAEEEMELEAVAHPNLTKQLLSYRSFLQLLPFSSP